MKLIVIYGPPAVGKLTVSREIEKLTGIKVFHNHLSIDCILPIFDFGTKPFGKLVKMIRLETIAEAAREDVDLIFTVCYAKGLDDKSIDEVTRAAENNGGEVHFVLLVCDKHILDERAVGESRSEFRKPRSIETLQSFFEKYDLFSPIPDRPTLHIDNTNIPPKAVAQQIVDHFGLNR